MNVMENLEIVRMTINVLIVTIIFTNYNKLASANFESVKLSKITNNIEVFLTDFATVFTPHLLNLFMKT